MKAMKFKVSGMTCGGCAKSIEQGFKSLPKVADVKVNLTDKTMEVTSDLKHEDVLAVLEDLGFEGELLT